LPETGLIAERRETACGKAKRKAAEINGLTQDQGDGDTPARLRKINSLRAIFRPRVFYLAQWGKAIAERILTMPEFTPCASCDEPEACEIVSRCLEPQLDMRAEFQAWVQDRGCDSDGAWSAWQGCWNLLSAKDAPPATEENYHRLVQTIGYELGLPAGADVFAALIPAIRERCGIMNGHAPGCSRYYCNKCGSFPSSAHHNRPDGTECQYIARLRWREAARESKEG
jgi:hypothetical protein